MCALGLNTRSLAWHAIGLHFELLQLCKASKNFMYTVQQNLFDIIVILQANTEHDGIFLDYITIRIYYII